MSLLAVYHSYTLVLSMLGGRNLQKVINVCWEKIASQIKDMCQSKAARVPLCCLLILLYSLCCNVLQESINRLKVKSFFFHNLRLSLTTGNFPNCDHGNRKVGHHVFSVSSDIGTKMETCLYSRLSGCRC